MDPRGLWDWGDPIDQRITDASAGFGDSLSFGATSAIRDMLGSNGGVNKCSDAYNIGEWGATAFSLATGVAGGIKAAGTKGVVGSGIEFSHWIPSRYFRENSNSYKPIITKIYGRVKDTILNGNYVSSYRHYLHDNFRYPKGWRNFNSRLPTTLQQLDRIPNIYKGGVAGGAYGAAGKQLNDECTCSK